jgi:dTDP-glucose pyrophosphorylase/predicted transcriptional regulator
MNKDKLKTLLVPPDTSIKQTMQKLNETAERILFVVDGQNRLLGTVTDGDIRRGIINGLGFGDSVKSVMYKNFIALNSDTPDIESHAKKLMLENKIEQVPVVSGGGEIAEVILWTDVLEEKVRPRSSELFDNRVVIMAGGKGTRLDPFTKVLPKPLIPIGDRPIIEVIMENFHRSGFNNFIYTLNYKKEYIKLFLKENQFPYTIDYVEEDEYLGTAGSLSLLGDRVGDTFFVINCDTILDANMAKVLAWHKEHGAAITIIGCHNEVKIPFGILEMKGGCLERIMEKPVHDVIINTGAYVMEPHVVSYIDKGKQMNMNELIDVVAAKEKVVVYPLYEGWLDIGQWEEYRKTLKKFGEADHL